MLLLRLCAIVASCAIATCAFAQAEDETKFWTYCFTEFWGPQKGYVSGLTHASYRKDTDIENGWNQHVDGLNPPKHANRRHTLCYEYYTEEEARSARDRYIASTENDPYAPISVTRTQWVLGDLPSEGGEQGGELWVECGTPDHGKQFSTKWMPVSDLANQKHITGVFAVTNAACPDCSERFADYCPGCTFYFDRDDPLAPLTVSWKEYAERELGYNGTSISPPTIRGSGSYCQFSKNAAGLPGLGHFEEWQKSGTNPVVLTDPNTSSWNLPLHVFSVDWQPSEFLASMPAAGVAQPSDAATQAQATEELLAQPSDAATQAQATEELLDAAVIGSNLALVRNAIREGADIDAKRSDAEGATALMWAAYRGNKAMVVALLEAGANVNATDNYGDTAIDEARIGGYSDIVDILRAHGGKGGDALPLPAAQLKLR